MDLAGTFSRLPALPLCLGAVAGVIAAVSGIGASICACVAIALIFILLIHRQRHPAWIFLAGAFASFTLAMIMRPVDVPQKLFDREIDWRGRIESARIGERSGKYLVEVDSPASFRCELLVASIIPEFEPGEFVRFKGAVEHIDKFDEVPGWSHRQGIGLSDRLSARCIVTEHDIVGIGCDDSFLFRLRRMRSDLADAVYTSGLAPSTSKLIVGSWLGGSDAGEDVRELFRATGLSHLLCVSGFHAAVLAAFLAFLFFPVRMFSHGRTVFYVSVPLIIWCYAVVSGFQPSVVRASVMISAFMMARVMQREPNPFNALFLACAVIIFINPYWLFSVGFQLSVCAVASLLLFADKFNPFHRRNRFAYRAAALFAVPLAAMLGTTPVLLLHFHTLPLLTVPANALASLAFPPMMVGGAVVSLFSSLGLPTDILVVPVNQLAYWLTRLCQIIAGFEAFRFNVVSFPVWNCLALVAAIALLALTFYCKSNKVKLFAGAMAVCSFLFVMPQSSTAHKDSILIYGGYRGTEMAAVVGDEAYQWSLSGHEKTRADFAPYFKAKGIGFEAVKGKIEGSISIGACRLVRASKGFTVCELKPDILLVDSRYDGDAHEMLSRIKPVLVLASPALEPEVRHKIAETCEDLGLLYHDLSLKAFYKEL